MRRHAEHIYHGLKAAFGRLVDLNGGQVTVVRLGLTRGEQTDLSRWASRNDEHVSVKPRFAAVDIIADLEHACGEPIVSRTLAALTNHILVPLPDGAAMGSVVERMGRSSKEFGEVQMRAGQALRDGKITRAEAHDILAEIRDAMLELAALAEAVKATTARGDE